MNKAEAVRPDVLNANYHVITNATYTLYARHPLERVGLEKSKNCQKKKGGAQKNFSIKGVFIKRVWQK